MMDENGIKLSDKEIIDCALAHLAEACAFLFETESNEGNVLAFMADSLIKCATVVSRGDDVLLAAADYNKYECKVYSEFLIQKRKRSIK